MPVALLARRRRWLLPAAGIVAAGLFVLGLSAPAAAATVSPTLTWEGTIDVSDRIDHEYSFTAEFGGGGEGTSTTIISHSWTLPPTSGTFTEGEPIDIFATYSPTSQSGTVEGFGSGTTLCQAQPLTRTEARNGTLLFSSGTPPVGWLRYDADAGKLGLDPSPSGTGVFQILFPAGVKEYSSSVSACSSGPDATPPFSVGMFTPKFLQDADQDLRLPATREGDVIRVQGTFMFTDDGDGALGGFGAAIGPTANFAVLTEMGGGPVQITSSVEVDLVGRIRVPEEPPPAGPGRLVIRKLTDTGDTSESFLFSQFGSCVASYTLTHDQSRDPACVAPAGSSVTVLEAATSAWKLTGISCDKGNPSVDLAAGRLQISLLADDTITCTFTNTDQRGAMTLRKTLNGIVDPSKHIGFVLTGDGLPADGITRSTLGDQDGVLEWPTLMPGQYTVCETPVPAGFTSFWKLDGMIVTPLNPDAARTPPEDLGNRCYDFTIAPVQERAFEVDNSHPGGDPRTIGYWKNWNRCTSGNHSSTAAKNGGAAAGFFLVEDLLPQVIGDVSVTSCQQAVKLLSKQDQAGKNRASDAAYELGAQLLAARFNLAAGAETCLAVQQAVIDGQTLLDGINFSSSGEYLGSKSKNVRRPQALALAAMLESYNTGNLC